MARKSKKHARITAKDLQGAARDMARFVERMFQGKGGKGADKRALAIALINSAVDLPFIDEGTEAEIIGGTVHEDDGEDYKLRWCVECRAVVTPPHDGYVYHSFECSWRGDGDPCSCGGDA